MPKEKRNFSKGPWSTVPSKGGHDIYVVTEEVVTGVRTAVCVVKNGVGIFHSPHAEDDAFLISKSLSMLKQIKATERLIRSLIRCGDTAKAEEALIKIQSFLDKIEYYERK